MLKIFLVLFTYTSSRYFGKRNIFFLHYKYKHVLTRTRMNTYTQTETRTHSNKHTNEEKKNEHKTSPRFSRQIQQHCSRQRFPATFKAIFLNSFSLSLPFEFSRSLLRTFPSARKFWKEREQTICKIYREVFSKYRKPIF